MTKPARFSPRYYLRPRNLPCDGTDSVIGGDIWPFDIENRNSQQPSLERVYCVFECFRQCAGLAIVQKYTAHITVKEADFYLNAYVSEENFFEFPKFIATTFLHFSSTHFLLMMNSSVFSSFIMRSHEINFDGSIFFAYLIFLISDEI